MKKFISGIVFPSRILARQRRDSKRSLRRQKKRRFHTHFLFEPHTSSCVMSEHSGEMTQERYIKRHIPRFFPFKTLSLWEHKMKKFISGIVFPSRILARQRRDSKRSLRRQKKRRFHTHTPSALEGSGEKTIMQDSSSDKKADKWTIY
ncbi:hypothetical protein IC621_24340 [Bacillus sp. IB182487]|uniref:Uncharacterized protein n=2 Tax=Metabacillus arenae TaxID=2771434 RepID=A0A926NLL0_9BACI|nr:hypothetical protein [Metabacillus arenae]